METAPLCEAHRATCRCTRYTPPKATWDCGKCTSEDKLSQRVLPRHAGNLVLKREENKFFQVPEVMVAWTEAYGQGYGK